jgi:hypothetical protein
MTGLPRSQPSGSALSCWTAGPVTLYTGDAHQALAALPDESVDCVVTSPPYWGLRDYGTGRWSGGRPDCPTVAAARRTGRPRTCPTCAAVWEDQQHGLEATLTDYIDRLIAVFRQTRRPL